MPNELTPPDGQKNWIEQLNLPKIIAGPAGEAISRLIAGAADIPTAWLEQKATEIRDTTDAKTVVSQAMADKVAAKINEDPELLERAKNSFIVKELRKQENKESIAQKSIEYMSRDTTSTDQPKAPEDDWLNVFERYAEQASSEKIQDMWARVLSGEIRRPKSFSLRTLRFISELDQDTAKLFEEYANAIISYHYMAKPQDQESNFGKLIQLQESGLLSEVGGSVRQNFVMGKDGLVLSFGSHWVHIVGIEGTKFHMPCIIVTKIGREVATILRKTLDRKRLDEFVALIPKANLDRIDLGTVSPIRQQIIFYPVETLWKKKPESKIL